MSLRVAFDLDGVLADIETAYGEVVTRLLAPERTTRSVTAVEESDEDEEGSSDTAAAAEVPRDEEGAGKDEVTVTGFTRRQRKLIWRTIGSTPDFWTTLRPLEPGRVLRLHEVAARHKWDVFFVTQRPVTAGETVQRQTQRWLVEQGFDLPTVLVLRGSRGQVAKALQLDFLVDDRLQHCVDVASESNARAILILRRDDPTAAQGAKRLGIEVVPSVTEALDLLEREQQARVKPTLLERIARKVGWDG